MKSLGTLGSFGVLMALLLAVACSRPAAQAEGEVDATTQAPVRAATANAPDVARTGISAINDPLVRTVQFGIAGLELSEPIVDLGGTSPLLLAFDILEGDVRDLRYTLTHCDKDWRPSQLSPIDYLAGFTEGDVTDFDFSFSTQTAYTHYSLTLPNQYIRWTKSGNYLLNVFDDLAEEPLMVLRFVVVEPLITLQVVPTRPASVQKDRTHQEFDVAINLRDARLENPRRSLSLTVVQNGDWRTGLYDLAPRFIRDELLLWDYQDKIVFPALREWRTLDLRTLASAGGRIRDITNEGGVYDVQLFPEVARVDFPPETRIDLNGRYVIEDFDNQRVRARISTDTSEFGRLQGQRFDRDFADLQRLRAEYADVLYTLKAPSGAFDGDVYLYGALTNYALDETTRGVYNPLVNGYVFKQRLKQGFYDYAYVEAGPDGFRPVWTQTEGNTFGTENAYQFLLYYRPYGERYDRVISYDNVQVNR